MLQLLQDFRNTAEVEIPVLVQWESTAALYNSQHTSVHLSSVVVLNVEITYLLVILYSLM